MRQFYITCLLMPKKKNARKDRKSLWVDALLHRALKQRALDAAKSVEAVGDETIEKGLNAK